MCIRTFYILHCIIHIRTGIAESSIFLSSGSRQLTACFCTREEMMVKFVTS